MKMLQGAKHAVQTQMLTVYHTIVIAGVYVDVARNQLHCYSPNICHSARHPHTGPRGIAVMLFFVMKETICNFHRYQHLSWVLF